MAKRWSPEEDELLLKLRREGFTAREIALRVRRTESAVKTRLADKLKVRERWSSDEIEKLTELRLQGKPALYIAKVLDRSQRAIESKIAELNI